MSVVYSASHLCVRYVVLTRKLSERLPAYLVEDLAAVTRKLSERLPTFAL
jgi:hypothetical protein